MVNRNFTNISCKALGQLISLKDAASRKVSKNAVYDRERCYSRSSVNLFVLLNFLVSTSDGTAQGLLIKDLAHEIGCVPKTVVHALDKLSSGSEPLISYNIDSDTQLLNVEILNYKDMFKRRGEGGLGYIVMNRLMRVKLAMMDNVNELRVLLRALLECEEQEGYEASLSIKQFMSGLPSYIRPCNIKAALGGIGMKKVFDLLPNKNHTAYHFSVNKESRAKDIKEALVGENSGAIRQLVAGFNETIDFINSYHSLDRTDRESKIGVLVSRQVRELLKISFNWEEAVKEGMKMLPKFNFTSREFEDAALIATHLDIDSVKGALIRYMEQFVLRGKGSTRRDTMAIIQNMSEAIYSKTNTFFLPEDKDLYPEHLSAV